MGIKKLIRIPSQDKAEGSICVAEGSSSDIPFNIQRVYYCYGAEAGIIRGRHAHKTLEQILICVNGEIEVTLDDGKRSIESIILKEPSQGLYVGPSTWRTMEWLKSDSILLVLASQHYDVSDYMRDYNEFLAWVNKER